MSNNARSQIRASKSSSNGVSNIVYNIKKKSNAGADIAIGKDELCLKRQRSERELGKKQKNRDSSNDKPSTKASSGFLLRNFGSPKMIPKADKKKPVISQVSRAKSPQSIPDNKNQSRRSKSLGQSDMAKSVKFNLKSNETLVFDKQKIISKSRKKSSSVPPPAKGILKKVKSNKKATKKIKRR